MSLIIPQETKDREWRLGARNRRAGLSLSQSYKHIDRYEHETRIVHSNGWHSMDQYLYLKKIDEEFTEKEREYVGS
jgi:hypothetical protein